MSGLTCVSCHVAFSTSDLHRQHYKSDWHRYNLMRKVAELPPITFEIYEHRSAIQRQNLTETKPESSYCQVCRKYFGTENALSNHLQSKKHLEAKAKPAKLYAPPKRDESAPQMDEIATKSVETKPKLALEELAEDAMDHEDEEDWESVDGDTVADSEDFEFTGDALEDNQCLFCGLQSPDLELNVNHMTKSHSFFIPDIDYLTDLPGLLSYLGEKVGAGRLCLWCSSPGSRRFRNVQAVQRHMLDKGHCKIKHEGNSILEYANYYDYSSSHPEVEDQEAMENDDVDIPTLDGDDWQLVLPSGATVGHRSLKIYFKQNMKPDRPERKTKLHFMLNNLMHQYKALGWTGTTTCQAVRRAKDIKYVKHIQDKSYMRLGVKANKFQPHLRPQVIF